MIYSGLRHSGIIPVEAHNNSKWTRIYRRWLAIKISGLTLSENEICTSIRDLS